MLKKQNIQIYSTRSELKPSVVERFNRTLREKMYRYFSYSDSYRYIDVLDLLLNNYNKSFNRSIKTEPINLKKIKMKIKFFINYTNIKNKKEIRIY